MNERISPVTKTFLEVVQIDSSKPAVRPDRRRPVQPHLPVCSLGFPRDGQALGPVEGSGAKGIAVTSEQLTTLISSAILDWSMRRILLWPKAIRVAAIEET